MRFQTVITGLAVAAGVCAVSANPALTTGLLAVGLLGRFRVGSGLIPSPSPSPSSPFEGVRVLTGCEPDHALLIASQFLYLEGAYDRFVASRDHQQIAGFCSRQSYTDPIAGDAQMPGFLVEDAEISCTDFQALAGRIEAYCDALDEQSWAGSKSSRFTTSPSPTSTPAPTPTPQLSSSPTPTPISSSSLSSTPAPASAPISTPSPSASSSEVFYDASESFSEPAHILESNPPPKDEGKQIPVEPIAGTFAAVGAAALIFGAGGVALAVNKCRKAHASNAQVASFDFRSIEQTE